MISISADHRKIVMFAIQSNALLRVDHSRESRFSFVEEHILELKYENRLTIVQNHTKRTITWFIPAFTNVSVASSGTTELDRTKLCSFWLTKYSKNLRRISCCDKFRRDTKFPFKNRPLSSKYFEKNNIVYHRIDGGYDSTLLGFKPPQIWQRARSSAHSLFGWAISSWKPQRECVPVFALSTIWLCQVGIFNASKSDAIKPNCRDRCKIYNRMHQTITNDF